jgi:hypothetical protein
MTNAQSRDADAAAAYRAAKLEVTTTTTFPATLLAALASFGGRPDHELSEDERGILWLARTFKAAVDDVLPRASAVARDTLAVATFVLNDALHDAAVLAKLTKLIVVEAKAKAKAAPADGAAEPAAAAEPEAPVAADAPSRYEAANAAAVEATKDIADQAKREKELAKRLAALMKKETPDCPLVRVKQGVYALRDWDEKTIRGEAKKAKKARTDAEEPSDAPEDLVADGAETPDDEPAPDSAPADVVTTVSEDDDDEVLIPVARPAAEPSQKRAVAAPARTSSDEDEPLVDGPDERFRREILASAADMFEEEDDDDQPILGGNDERPAEGADSAEGRRRRRRRRRGRGAAGDIGGLPSYTATPVDAVAAPRVETNHRENNRDRDRDRDHARERHARDRRDHALHGRAHRRGPLHDLLHAPSNAARQRT